MNRYGAVAGFDARARRMVTSGPSEANVVVLDAWRAVAAPTGGACARVRPPAANDKTAAAQHDTPARDMAEVLGAAAGVGLRRAAVRHATKPTC